MVLGSSQDGHSSTPLVCVSRDSWDTRTILGSSRDGHSSPPPPPPCLSILGFLGYLDDPGIIPGWTQLYPPCLSILGFLGYSDDPGIIPGWTQLIPPPPPLSEYPGIPGILVRSWDHPGMDAPHPPPLSEYPGIPEILGRSQNHPGTDGHSSTPPF